MTTRTRKPRSDSIPEMTRIMQGAAREVAPPAHVPLDDGDWPFWHSVVQEFARADWTEHQLELAALMARTIADQEREQRLLRQEGTMIERDVLDKEGNVKYTQMIENPRVRIVQSFAAQVHSTRRSLALHAKGKHPSAADAANARESNKATERRVAKDDDLLS